MASPLESKPIWIPVLYTGSCLSAVERPAEPIYGQLMRGHVCAGTCSPLYICGDRSCGTLRRISQETGQLHTGSTLSIGCRNGSCVCFAPQSLRTDAVTTQGQRIWPMRPEWGNG